MDFELNQSQLRIQELARAFAREQVAPFAGDWEERGEIPREFLLQMARQGFAAMTAPSEFGGSGLDLVSFALALMEVSEVSPSLAQLISSNTVVCHALAAFGAPSQKKRYLAEHVAGGAIGSVALLEPEAGHDLSAVRTGATPTEGGYLLRGQKAPVTGLDLRGIAIVSARFVSFEGKPSAPGLTLFIVDKRREGVRVVKTERNFGLRACGISCLELENCFVPDKNRLGEEDRGLKMAQSILGLGRVAAAAQAARPGDGLPVIREAAMAAQEQGDKHLRG